MNERKLRALFADIEKVAEGLPVEVMPQMLAAESFLRQIYEYSVDLVYFVVYCGCVSMTDVLSESIVPLI